VRFLYFCILLILFSYPLSAEEFVLYDSYDSSISWEIIPDGYIVTYDNYSQTKDVYSEKYEKVLGVSLEYPELNTLTYYILKPDKAIEIPQLKEFNDIEITIYSNMCNIDIAFLVEDNSGTEYEYYMGTLNYDGWMTLVLSLFTEINGFNLKGIIFYNKQENRPRNSSKVFYIKDIILNGYTE
jgi:hypothetical protein